MTGNNGARLRILRSPLRPGTNARRMRSIIIADLDVAGSLPKVRLGQNAIVARSNGRYSVARESERWEGKKVPVSASVGYFPGSVLSTSLLGRILNGSLAHRYLPTTFSPRSSPVFPDLAIIRPDPPWSVDGRKVTLRISIARHWSLPDDSSYSRPMLR